VELVSFLLSIVTRQDSETFSRLFEIKLVCGHKLNVIISSLVYCQLTIKGNVRSVVQFDDKANSRMEEFFLKNQSWSSAIMPSFKN
jgi:hypothetical protein